MSSVKKGDVLLTSEPYVMVVLPHASVIYCNHCMARAKEGSGCEVTCPHCRYTKYCSDACFDQAWAVHRYECEAAVRLGKMGGQAFSTMARLLANIIIKHNKEGIDEEEWIDLDNIRTYTDLKSHKEDIAKSEKKKKEATKLYDELKEILQEAPKPGLPSFEDFLTIYGKVSINSYSILDDWLSPIGRGLYLAGSMIDHSCHPNAFVSFRGPVMVVRSLIDAPSKQWDQIRISYCDVMNDVIERQETLKDDYCFTCHCHVCACPVYSHVTTAVKCGNPDCLGPIFLDGYNDEEISRSLQTMAQETVDILISKDKTDVTLSCCEFHKNKCSLPPVPVPGSSGQMNGAAPKPNKASGELTCACCGHKNSGKELQEKYSKLVDLTRKKLGPMLPDELPSLEDCTSLVEEHGDFLHSTNPWRGMVLEAAFRSAMRSKSVEAAIKFGKSNTAAYRFHYGEQSPKLGIFFLKLGIMELANSNAQFALKLLDESKLLIKTGVGASHPLITEICNKYTSEAETLAPRRNEEIENLLFIVKNCF